MSATFPGASVPAVGQGGFFSYPWLTYFQGLSAQPSGPVSLVAGSSPFSYTASGPGTLFINGGTISGVSFKRGGATVSVSGSSIPMANQDVVTVTFTGSPAFVFIPG